MQSLPQHNRVGLWVLSTCLFFGVSAARSESPVSGAPPQLPSPGCGPEHDPPKEGYSLGNLHLR